MQQNLKNNGQRANRLAGRFAAEKKKMVIALCLIALMVFMWVRVLGKKGPQGAEASFMGQMADTAAACFAIKNIFYRIASYQRPP